MKKRIGLIGVGAISDWHVRAVREAGMEVTVVSARPGSARIREFARKHNILRVVEDWKKMLEHPEDWDGLLIASRTEAAAQIVGTAMDLNVPILAEKPVAMTSDILNRLVQKSHRKVWVGYNRRFYDPVRYARDFVRRGEPLIAHMSLPESITPGETPKEGRSYLYPFFENSCHGMDLLRFVFGDLKIAAVRHLKTHSGRMLGFAAVLTNDREDTVQLSANWGTPANFGLTLDRPGRRVELKPFEIATVYEGMEVVHPTDECPIRRYLPKVAERIHLSAIDLREKPGFVKQAEAFREILEGKPPDGGAATLHDALETIKLCEDLVGQKCPAGQEDHVPA